MLVVEITSHFSVSQHVQRLVTASAQTIYALRVLRSCGLNNAALLQVYRATVVARLMYAASAWRDFMKASDRLRIDSAIMTAPADTDTAHRIFHCATLRTMSCSVKG